MLRYLIIGGGPQGTHLARMLTGAGGIDTDDLRIVDPHHRPLALWKRLTGQCAMPYLRSPHTHNIDGPIMSLRRFWADRTDAAPTAFIAPYLRPSLALFNRHCDHVVAAHGLGRQWIRGRALGVAPCRGGLRVAVDGAHYDTRHLVLALGRNEHPFWPSWARRLAGDGAPVCHVYDAGTDPGAQPPSGETVIVGGGISAASLAGRLAAGGAARVTLLTRRPVRTDNLDFDPCWAGPKCIRPFGLMAYDLRRAVVDRERRRGTVTEEVAGELAGAVRDRRLRIVTGGDFSASLTGGRVRFRTVAGDVMADQVVLATGFEKGPPGGAFLSGLVRNLGLPVAACGYPRLSPDLRWHDRIRVMGPLAELVIGPAAGNIIGGRLAAQRILGAAAPGG